MLVLVFKSGENFAFPRRYRISRREGFTDVLKRSAKTSFWFLIYSQPNHLGCARLGVSVSKRVVAEAVQRNKVKRLIRENFRLQNQKGAGKDVVVRLRRRLDEQEWKSAAVILKDSLRQILSAQ